jgi:thiamine biosynthesis protein ThiI
MPEYCALQPRHALTSVTARALLAEARQLGPLGVAQLVAERQVVEARGDGGGDGASVALDGDIPAGAVVLDLRSKEDYQRWHAPGALWLEFFEALHAAGSLPPEPTYVLYCEVGFKSAHLAELLRRRGVDARHGPGGAPWLSRRRARAREPESVA